MRITRPTRTAMALGTGLLLTGLAASPATAEPLNRPDGWTAEHGSPGGYFLISGTPDDPHASFTTEFEAAAEDVRVTVAPVLEGDARGDEVDVPFTYDEELEQGGLDIAEARRSLGEAGTGPVVLGLHVLGDQVATLSYGPDEDLTDENPGEPLGADNRHELHFGMLPTEWDTTLLAAPGERHVFISSNTGDEAAPLTLVSGPTEGRIVEVTEAETGGPRGFVYQAPEGFTGSDTVTLQATRDGVTVTETVTVRFGDPRVDLFDWKNERIPGFVNFPVDGLFDDAPAEDEPAEDEHTVPDEVETGRGLGWWPAAVGMAAAGALALVRRSRTTA